MPPSTGKKKIEQILDWVSRRENAWGARFRVMDDDWELYNLKPFIPPRGDGVRAEEAFTSSKPRIVADKLIGVIAGANQIIRTEMDHDSREEREKDENYERLSIGMLKIADQKLEDSGAQPLRTQLALNAIVQGGYVAARFLLRKDSDGETIVDITPIKPRQLLIQFGDRGPVAAAIITRRDRASIRAEYPKFTFEDEQDEDESQTHQVTDYYWKEDGKFWNAVIVEGKWAKRPADTFAKRFPIVARAVGAHSTGSGNMTLREDSTESIQISDIEHFAQSVFAPVRNLVPYINRLNSYRLTMARRSVMQIQKVMSLDGEKEIEGDIDEDTTEISLSTENGEDIVPLQVQEMTRDVDSMQALADAEFSDATLPPQSFGRIPSPLSGNALAILGAAEAQRLEPFVRPIESCLEAGLEALASQFETGRYKPIKVSGRTRDRKGFVRTIKPEDINGRDRITVELVAERPQDQQERWLAAQLATQPGPNGMPLVSHFTAWEDILKMQDSDLEAERIFAQMARTSTPNMLLTTQMVAAERRGDEATVEELEREMQKLINDEAMQRFAQKIAFLTMLFQNPLQAITAGAQRQTDQSANPEAQDPLRNIDPRLFGLSGVAPGSVQPSPDAGFNTSAPRQSREAAANSIGITLATPEQTQQFG